MSKEIKTQAIIQNNLSTVESQPEIQLVKTTNDNWSPAKGMEPAQHGKIAKKPWEYACEAWIPVLDTPDTLEIVIQLLRLQTARPYIVLVDTGSTKENFELMEQRFGDCEDIEIHRLRFKGVIHSSDYPAHAMDLAMSVCRTEHLFCTHTDVFLRKQNVLEELILLTDNQRPAVGYQMTPRDHADWEYMVSHTCTMLHIPTMDRISASWSLRRLCNRKELEFITNHPEMGNNWPDTEILLNYYLWENGFEAKLIGEEKNHERTLDHRIDHCRTLTAARLYSPEAAKIRQEWVNDAITQAKERIELWSK